MTGLRTFLLEQTAKGGDRQVLQYVTDLLNKNVGFLINERFINIPAQVWIINLYHTYFNFHLALHELDDIQSRNNKEISPNF